MSFIPRFGKHPNLSHAIVLGALIRMATGIYWLFFSSQRWFDYSGFRDLITSTANDNSFPVYGDFLKLVVAPNWEVAIILQTSLEAVVGVLLLVGLLTRLSSVLGVLLALNLTLTFAPPAQDFGLIFWFYFLAVMVNASILTNRSNRWIGLDRYIARRMGRFDWFF